MSEHPHPKNFTSDASYFQACWNWEHKEVAKLREQLAHSVGSNARSRTETGGEIVISDEEIDTLVEQHKRAPEEVYYRDFARAIYQLGRQHQRESDAALCKDAADRYLERSKRITSDITCAASLASNAAATCLETAIRANIGES